MLLHGVSFYHVYQMYTMFLSTTSFQRTCSHSEQPPRSLTVTHFADIEFLGYCLPVRRQSA